MTPILLALLLAGAGDQHATIVVPEAETFMKCGGLEPDGTWSALRQPPAPLAAEDAYAAGVTSATRCVVQGMTGQQLVACLEREHVAFQKKLHAARK